MALQLGVDVFSRACQCRFCGAAMDSEGVHAASCNAGGDMVLRHNAVRDIVFDFARRGQLQPVLEK